MKQIVENPNLKPLTEMPDKIQKKVRGNWEIDKEPTIKIGKNEYVTYYAEDDLISKWKAHRPI